MKKISKLQLRIGVYKMYISDFFYRLRHLYDTDEYHRGFEDGYAVAKRNAINNLEGNIIKYICRWKDKNGIEDLEKIKHYCDLLISLSKKI